MPLPAPVLDDRSFEDIRQELLARIPVYTPEWTDRSRSDPAITLLELFAFLGEGLQFRFNQIPEATRLAFLNLLHVPLRTAEPATAIVRASLRKGPLAPKGVVFYAGDQLRAGKVVFTVDHDAPCWPLDCLSVVRLPAEMPGADEPELAAAVQATVDAVADADPSLGAVVPYATATLASDGTTPPVDPSASIDGSLWIAVLRDDPVQTLDAAPGSPVALSVGISPEPTVTDLDDVSPCPGTAPAARPALEWHATAAMSAPGNAPRMLRLGVTGDTTAGFETEGAVRVELPADRSILGLPSIPQGLEGTGAFPPVLDEPEVADRLWFWIRVFRSDGGRIGPLRLVCLNALAVTQAEAARPELVGIGNGQSGQTFALSKRPVLMSPRHRPAIEVLEEGVWTRWSLTESLDASRADDRHVSVDAEAGLVVFGSRGPQVGERVRALSYFSGGGSAGNVPPKAITALGEPLPEAPAPGNFLRPAQSPPQLVNPFAASGGADSETIEAALDRIPGELRRRDRCVTASDFEELALQTPGADLARAGCLPLFHAPDRAHPWPGAVSVVVWPARDLRNPERPAPDRATLQRVCRFLDARRLVTTELYVIPPTYREVAVSVSVKIRGGYGLDAVRAWVELVLRRYLAPLPPYGPDGTGWPLGRRIIDRELEGVVSQVEGVEWVEALALAGNVSGTLAPMTVVPIERWMVPALAAVAVVDDATVLPDPGGLVQPPPSGNAVPIPVIRETC